MAQEMRGLLRWGYEGGKLKLAITASSTEYGDFTHLYE